MNRKVDIPTTPVVGVLTTEQITRWRNTLQDKRAEITDELTHIPVAVLRETLHQQQAATALMIQLEIQRKLVPALSNFVEAFSKGATEIRKRVDEGDFEEMSNKSLYQNIGELRKNIGMLLEMATLGPMAKQSPKTEINETHINLLLQAAGQVRSSLENLPAEEVQPEDEPAPDGDP